jgi:hypothetical protein
MPRRASRFEHDVSGRVPATARMVTTRGQTQIPTPVGATRASLVCAPADATLRPGRSGLSTRTASAGITTRSEPFTSAAPAAGVGDQAEVDDGVVYLAHANRSDGRFIAKPATILRPDNGI